MAFAPSTVTVCGRMVHGGQISPSSHLSCLLPRLDRTQIGDVPGFRWSGHLIEKRLESRVRILSMSVMRTFASLRPRRNPGETDSTTTRGIVRAIGFASFHGGRML